MMDFGGFLFVNGDLDTRAEKIEKIGKAMRDWGYAGIPFEDIPQYVFDRACEEVGLTATDITDDEVEEISRRWL